MQALNPGATLTPVTPHSQSQNAINRGRARRNALVSASSRRLSAAQQAGPHRSASVVGHRSPPPPRPSSGSRAVSGRDWVKDPHSHPVTSWSLPSASLKIPTSLPRPRCSMPGRSTLNAVHVTSAQLSLPCKQGRPRGLLTWVSSGTGSSFVRVGGSSATSEAGREGSEKAR